MEYHQEINLKFVTVCSDIQQSSKAHGLTYQILQWGYTATVCVCVCKCACVCIMCACVCVSGCMCDMHAHSHMHTQCMWQVGPCALDCPYHKLAHVSISHHHWFTNILVTWTELSTEVHQTLLTCSGDVIHP